MPPDADVVPGVRGELVGAPAEVDGRRIQAALREEPDGDRMRARGGGNVAADVVGSPSNFLCRTHAGRGSRERVLQASDVLGDRGRRHRPGQARHSPRTLAVRPRDAIHVHPAHKELCLDGAADGCSAGIVRDLRRGSAPIRDGEGAAQGRRVAAGSRDRLLFKTIRVDGDFAQVPGLLHEGDCPSMAVPHGLPQHVHRGDAGERLQGEFYLAGVRVEVQIVRVFLFVLDGERAAKGGLALHRLRDEDGWRAGEAIHDRQVWYIAKGIVEGDAPYLMIVAGDIAAHDDVCELIQGEESVSKLNIRHGGCHGQVGGSGDGLDLGDAIGDWADKDTRRPHGNEEREVAKIPGERHVEQGRQRLGGCIFRDDNLFNLRQRLQSRANVQGCRVPGKRRRCRLQGAAQVTPAAQVERQLEGVQDGVQHADLLDFVRDPAVGGDSRVFDSHVPSIDVAGARVPDLHREYVLARNIGIHVSQNDPRGLLRFDVELVRLALEKLDNGHDIRRDGRCIMRKKRLIADALGEGHRPFRCAAVYATGHMDSLSSCGNQGSFKRCVRHAGQVGRERPAVETKQKRIHRAGLCDDLLFEDNAGDSLRKSTSCSRRLGACAEAGDHRVGRAAGNPASNGAHGDHFEGMRRL
eukprot:scaffold1102_cov256-Pinguiococcus_pyrenoidosus.AAC.36